MAVTNALGYIHSTVINYRLGIWYDKNLQIWINDYIKFNPNFTASNQESFNLGNEDSDQ
jgi:hypothetical protein